MARSRLPRHPHRDEFERCVRHLDALISEFSAGVGAPGWGAFITADRVDDAQPLPAPTPTLAVWSTGPCIAPYVRSLKEWRPVVAAVSTWKSATIYRYRTSQSGTRRRVARASLRSTTPQHMGAPADRVAFTPGTHGKTGHDQPWSPERCSRAATAVCRGRRARRGSRRAATDRFTSWNPARARCTWPTDWKPVVPIGVLELDALDVHSSEAEIADAARSGASTTSRRRRRASDRRDRRRVRSARARIRSALAETRQRARTASPECSSASL